MIDHEETEKQLAELMGITLEELRAKLLSGEKISFKGQWEPGLKSRFIYGKNGYE